MNNKKTKKLNSEKRKKQIIESAMILFAKQGFNGTHTYEIAKKAKVSEALIFKLFPSKSSLYSAIIEYRIKQTKDIFNFVNQSYSSERELLMNIALSHIQKIEEDDTFMRILLFSALEGHRLSKIFFNTKVTKFTLYLAGYIEKKIKDGTFSNVDPIFAARIFMGMIYNYILLKKIYKVDRPKLPDKNTAVKAIVEIFLNGIIKNK